MTVFSLFLFVMMVLVGGMAVDLMRTEQRRVHLQYTLDRAVLAAASLRGADERDAETVVRDHLRAAGLPEDSVEVSIDPSSDRTYRRVSVRTTEFVQSRFLHMVGIDELAAPAAAEAAEEIADIELVLVLDMSSSMSYASDTEGVNRVEALKPPAKRFVSHLLAERPEAVSISIIPYHNHVWMGEEMARYFPVGRVVGEPDSKPPNRFHDFSSCARFAWEDYRTTAMTTGRLLQVAHYSNFVAGTADPNGGFENWSGRYRIHDHPGQIGLPIQKPACRSAGADPIMFQNDQTALHAMMRRWTIRTAPRPISE